MATRFAADRFVYVFAPDKRLTSGVGTTLDVFTDEACTTPAVITTLTSAVISGARLVVGNDSLLPEFLDTEDHVTLWVRPPGGTQASQISAVSEDMVSSLLGTQVVAGVEAYLDENPVVAEPSADVGNLLEVGTDGKILLSPTAIPDPVVDHGLLTGLSDDDHPQYLTQTRGDARYPLASTVTTALDGKVSSTDPRLTDARTPVSHNHAVADVTGLQATLDGKVATSDSRLSDARTPTAHVHTVANVTGLQTALDGKVATNDARLTDARTPTTHVHAIADTTGLQTALDGKASTSHNHDGAYLTPTAGDARYVRTVNGNAPDGSGEVTITTGSGDHGALTGLSDDDHPQYLTQTRGDARYPLASAVTTALAGKVATDDSRLTDSRPPTPHGHPQSDVTGLTTALADKVSTSDPRLSDSRTAIAHTHPQADITGLPEALTGKSDVGHGHSIANVTGLQTALDGKQASGDYATNGALTSGLATKADTSHGHSIADVTGLQTAIDGKQVAGDYATTSALTSGLAGKAALSHTHAISETTGLQTVLDGKAAASHVHSIANTTGLQTALDGKAATTHAHSISQVTNLQETLDGKLGTSGGVTLLGYSARVEDIPAGAAVGSVWVVSPAAFTYGDVPTVVASTITGTTVSGGNITVTTPSGSQAGDLLVVYLSSQEDEVALDWAVPTGWVRQSPAVANLGSGLNADVRVAAVMTRVLTAAGEATYTFTSTMDAQRRMATAILVRGVDTTAPVAATTAWQGVNGIGSTDLTIPSQTSVRPNNLQLVFAMVNVSSAQTTTPATPSPSMSQIATLSEPTSGAVSRTAQTAWSRSLTDAGGAGSIVLDFPDASQRSAIGLLLQPGVAL